MTEEIKQVLGFDASQAIAELTKLDTTLSQFEAKLRTAGASFTSFNQSAGRTVAAFIQLSKHGTSAASAIAAVSAAQGNMSPAANIQAATTAAAQLATSMNRAGIAGQSASVKIGNAMVRLGKTSTQTATTVVAGSQRMTTSLALLSRVVYTQAIVRALSTLRNSFKATANEAADFQKSISLIQTIDDSKQSADALSESVRKLSNEFNIPLLEASAGLFQSISNQVGNAAESLEFAAKSAEFAKATNSSLANSVDLLSGVLKSYNLNVSETDRISSVFFKTVDLGRINTDELANSFGRIGPRASDMGISIEETGAALASLTVRGLKTNEAITQLSGIMTSLAKPSDAMKEALKTLGVESGQAAIQTFGLFGTLQKLKAASGTTAAGMAALFPNVRALGGATSLLGDGLQSATNNLREMNAVGRDFAHNRFLQATANDGERVRREFNELKNVFVTEVGGALLQTTKQFFETTNATQSLTEAIKFAVPAVDNIAAAMGLLIGQLAAAKLGAAGLSTTLGALALIPAAVAGGELIGESINQQRRDAAVGSIEALHKVNEKEIADFRQVQQQKVDAANAADQARIQSARNAAQLISSVLTKEQISVKLDADQGVTALEEAFGRQITTLADYVTALEVASQKTAEFRKQQADAAIAQKQVTEIQEEIGHALDRLGERGLTDVAGLAVFSEGLTVVSELRNRINELSNSTSITDEQMESLRQQFLSFEQSVDSTAGKQFFLDDVQQLQQAFQLVQQLQQAQTQSVVDPNLPAYLTKLEQALALNPAGQFTQATQAMNAAVSPVNAIASAWERSAAAAERTARAAASASAGPVNQSVGGKMYLAGGGAARGVDTIPAMLAPGEFVMNAKASRQFYAQLQAMNAGQTPAYREQGGSVTNVGDISISVNGGPTDTKSLDNIGQGLRRRIRQGLLEL